MGMWWDEDRGGNTLMDLQVLKLNTVFKLKLLNLDQDECDKLCDKVMRSDTKTVKKIIHTYIRQNTQRKSTAYFYDNFVRKSSARFIRRLKTEQVKELISTELDSVLRNKFRRNKYNVKFQNIVDRAIECTQECSATTKDGDEVSEKIPYWIQQNYKLITKKVDGVESLVVVNQEAEYNEKLVDAMRAGRAVIQDIFELVSELEYYNHCKKQIALKKKLPDIPKSGTIDAFEYAEYYRVHWEESRSWQIDLDRCQERIDFLMAYSDMPSDIKKEVRENQYQLKSKKTKLFVGRMRRQFEEFIIQEKYDNPSDTFYRENNGALQLVRQRAINLEYVEENPSIPLDVFMFNCIVVKKKRFIPFYKKLIDHQHLKIIKTGKWKDVIKPNGRKIEYMYVIYDYLAPKKWFRQEFFDEVSRKLDEPMFMTINDEETLSYAFPYYSQNPYIPTKTSFVGNALPSSIQNRFTTNFRIFCNKMDLNGLSMRVADSWTNDDGEIETRKAIINPYQIYYPSNSHIDRRMNVTKEVKKRQYLGLYGCFYHEVKFTSEGNLKEGGNIIRECQFETGDNDMDFFISDIDARNMNLENYAQTNDQDLWNIFFPKFYKDVLENYQISHESKRLYKYITTSKKRQLNNIGRELDKYKSLYDMTNELKTLHGNSRKAKQLKEEISKVELPLDKIKQITRSIKTYRGLKKELRKNSLERYKNEFREMISEIARNYCEVRYYRQIRVQRDVVSLARVMANNLHIKGVARTYKTRKEDFIHKFMFEYRDNEIPLENGVVKAKTLMRILLKMSLALYDEDIFDTIYNLLLDLELEVKEKKLLIDFKGY